MNTREARSSSSPRSKPIDNPLQSIPAFSDLAQDVAGIGPRALAAAWSSGERTLSRAQELLEPYQVKGMVVSTDMVGLSRMTQQRPIAQVLHLVSSPKELIHQLGVGIGGQPIGTWIADNTELFFPEEVETDLAVAAMLEIHRRLAPGLPKLGLCLHYGQFYRLGGCVYGRDASLVEHLAEERSRAGETLITEAAARRLRRPQDFRLKRRPDLSADQSVYEVVNGPRPAGLPLAGPDYPAPFPPEVRQLLSDPNVRNDLLRSYVCDAAFLVVEACPASNGDDLVDLLDELAADALLDLIFRRSLPAESPQKTGGRLALAAVSSAAQALESARQVRREMAQNRLAVCCGIDSGGILVFPMPGGGWDFAGDAVNIASKQAEDCGQAGWIYLTERAAAGLSLVEATRCSWQFSGITIQSVALPPEPALARKLPVQTTKASLELQVSSERRKFTKPSSLCRAIL